MTNEQQYSGVWVPVLTPFQADMTVNKQAFVMHCHWLLEQGVDGLAVFGTTSEANSLSREERISLLECLIAAGVAPDRLMPGVGCCAISETVILSRDALDRGCRAVLMLPPFYYKNVSDEGLFQAFSWIIDQIASIDLKVFLYHIPPVAQVSISPVLIERLLAVYPQQIAGLKDSGGDWSFTREVLDLFPGLAVFAGSERFLLDTVRHGGAGCITASGNVNPSGIHLVYEQWRDANPSAETSQRRIESVRDMLEKFDMIPALKALCARHYDDNEWLRVRPPLTELSPSKRNALVQYMDELGFSMSDNRKSVSQAD